MRLFRQNQRGHILSTEIQQPLEVPFDLNEIPLEEDISKNEKKLKFIQNIINNMILRF